MATTISASLIISITHERDLLHLILHRNKNQHRHSLWFRWLRMLKRGLERLLTSQSELRIAAQLKHMRSVTIPGAYVAFTHLITSTQYAGLGCVLLAVLARVRTIVEEVLDDEEDEEVQEDITLKTTHIVGNDEELGEVISRDNMMRHLDQTTPSIKIKPKGISVASGEDVDERLLFVTAAKGQVTKETITESSTSKKTTSVSQSTGRTVNVTGSSVTKDDKQKVARKRRKVSTIDDLFDGL